MHQTVRKGPPNPCGHSEERRRRRILRGCLEILRFAQDDRQRSQNGGITKRRFQRGVQGLAPSLLAVFFLCSSFTYHVALPGRNLIFPQDHFSHPDFKTEWWYYTGHLETEGGKKYGYQVTFFRFGLRD